MLEFLARYWLEAILSSIVAIITFYVKKLYKDAKSRDEKREAEYNALKAGVMAILRDRLVQAYYHYEGRGTITLHGLENVNTMFKEYSNLGGNGSVKKLVADLNELPVVDK